MSKIESAVALCAVGAEKIVSNELRKLNLAVTESAFGRVRFKADIEGLYRALIGLRAADRVLLETAFFEAADFDALFEGVRLVRWEEFVPPGLGLKVAKVRSNRSKLAAETSIQAVVHKAAAERLCEKRRVTRLPEHGGEAELRIYIEKDRVSVLLDLSGPPLFRRGYRIQGGAAPLRETTAAAVILHSGWKRKFPLYDPFCGSGTLVIEAAMYAWDIAPGLGRRFALESLLPESKDAARKAREEFLAKVDFSRLTRLAGSDSESGAVKAAEANIARARALAGAQNAEGVPPQEADFSQAAPRGGVPPRGENLKPGSPSFFRVLPMAEATPPESFSAAMPAAGTGQGETGTPPRPAGAGGGTGAKKHADEPRGFIITNPPYGRRLGDPESAERTYTEMGRLANNFPGWKLVLITDHPGYESFFGRKADSCREITNGAIRSYLYQYEKL